MDLADPSAKADAHRAEPRQLAEVSQRLAGVDEPAALLAGLFSFAPVGFQVYRADGHCVLTNAEFRRMFGSEPPPDYNVLRDELAERAGVLGLIHRAFEGEVISVPTVWYDPRELQQVRVEQGNRVAMQATFFPLFDREGRVGHVAIAYKDVTAEVSARESAEAERASLASVREQVSRLLELTTDLAAALTVEEVATAVVKHGIRAVDASMGMVALVSHDGTELRVVHAQGYAADVEERLRSFAITDEWPLTVAVRTREPVFVDSRADDADRFPALTNVWRETGNEAVAVIPLIVEDRVVGALGLSFRHSNALDQHARSFALTLAGQCAQSLHRAQLHEAELQARARVRFLADLSVALAGSLDEDAVLQTTARGLVPALADACVVESLDASGRTVGRAAAGHHERTTAKSEAVVPLVARGHTLGTLSVTSVTAGRYRAAELATLRDVAERCAMALDTARLYTSEQTARQAAERASQDLRGSRDLLAGVLRGVSDGVTAQDLNGQLLFANQAAAEMTGYASPEEMLAAPPGLFANTWEMLDENGQPLRFADLPGRRAVHGESAPEALIRYRHRAGGEDRWSLVRAQTVRDASGEPVASITVTQDVTARKRADERLRFLAEASARLPASLDVADTLAAVASVAVETLADWCVLYLVDQERQVTESLVRHRDPAKIQQAMEFEQHYPPGRDEQSVIWQVLQTEQPLLISEIRDEVLERAARDPEHLRSMRSLGLASAIWVPLRARSRTLGILGLFTEKARRRLEPEDLALTEEVAARASLAIDNAVLYASERAARAQAEAAVRARDEFLGIASHELRNPVTGIIGTAQLIKRTQQRGTLDSARLNDYLDRMSRTASHLAVLTEDLLDVANLQRGELPLRLEQTDVAALVREAVERRAALDDDLHRIEVQLARDAWPLLVDRDRIQQLVDNLLDNAAKYSPGGGAIFVGLEDVDAGVQLSVRDEGIGLPPGAEESIFEPLKRARNATQQNIPGLGLGLYICRRLAEQHQGRLWASSPGEGLGTTFWLWLPDRADCGSAENALSAER